MSTIFTPSAISSGTLAAVTLCGSASSATSQNRPRLRAGTILELQIRHTIEVRVNRTERLANVIDRSHAHELDIGVHEEPARHLRAAVAAAADDCCLESLCHRGQGMPWPPRWEHRQMHSLTSTPTAPSR